MYPRGALWLCLEPLSEELFGDQFLLISLYLPKSNTVESKLTKNTRRQIMFIHLAEPTNFLPLLSICGYISNSSLWLYSLAHFVFDALPFTKF